MAAYRLFLKKWARVLSAPRILHWFLGLARYHRMIPKERRLGAVRCLCEQIALYFLNGLHPGEYYLYTFQDRSLSWKEKKAFISDSGSWKYWDVLDPTKYRAVFTNKLVAHRLLSAFGLPVPRLYGVFDPVWGRTESGAPLRSADDLRRWADDSAIGEFVIKPIECANGLMVLPLTRRGQGLEAVGGVAYSWDGLFGFMTDVRRLSQAYPNRREPPRTFLFQERLHRHEFLADFTTETVCCVRVMTLLNMAGEAEIVAASFKLPSSDRGVDNLEHGGLAVSVDLEMGTLGDGVRFRSLPPTRFRAPMQGGREFVGLRLPHWKELRETVTRAAYAFPLVRVVGWDIAVTDAGPVILDGNDTWSAPYVQQAPRQGLACGSFQETFLKLRGA